MRDIFEDLFVLEMTNNHQGKLARGLQIIHEFAPVAKFNGVRAAIKLQFRDVDTFVHRDWRTRMDIKYIRRITETRLTHDEYGTLVEAIRKSDCIPMATPFDEAGVRWCQEFELPIIKVASADGNDWFLLEHIAKTRKPVIVSTGGVSLKDMDNLVLFFENRNIPLALNHCVAAYPTEDNEMELHQIDFLRKRYPGHPIGLSSHEGGDWHTSLLLAYGMGVRLFERHIDIDSDGNKVNAYSSTPAQIDEWFRAYNRAVEFCGTADDHRRLFLPREMAYLDTYVRGVWASRDLEPGHVLRAEDLYLAIPLQKGQLSTRELLLGQYGHKITRSTPKDTPITVDAVDTPYRAEASKILKRGL